MKISLRKGICVIALMYCENAVVYGQSGMGKYEFGLAAGTYVYQGDLTPYRIGSIKTPGFGLTAFASSMVNKNLSLRGNIVYGKIRSDDGVYADPAYRKQRNFKFNASVLEGSALLVWDVLGKNSTAGRNGFSPYVFGGAGFSFVNIRRNWSAFNPEFFSAEPAVQAGLDEDIAHALPGVIPVIPVGIGVQYSLTPKIAINTEFTHRLMSADYLDGFSKSVHATARDMYSSASIGVVFKLGVKGMMDCPPALR